MQKFPRQAFGKMENKVNCSELIADILCGIKSLLVWLAKYENSLSKSIARKKLQTIHFNIASFWKWFAKFWCFVLQLRRMLDLWFLSRTMAYLSQIQEMKTKRAYWGVAGVELTCWRGDIENCKPREREKCAPRGFVSVDILKSGDPRRCARVFFIRKKLN